MNKAFIIVSHTVGVLSFIVSLVQICEYGMDFYKKVKKPKRVQGFSSR